MRRPWQIWLAFAASACVMAAAVGWLSFRALESEQSEQAARSHAALEENARLALWRIDSAVASLIAQENARPYFAYRSFYSPDEAHGKAANRKSAAAPLVPSPLLTSAENPQIKLYFEFDAAGDLHSPRVPTGALRARAVPRFLSAEQLAQGQGLLAQLAVRIHEPELVARLPAVDLPLITEPLVIAQSPAASFANQQALVNNAQGFNANDQQQVQAQQARGAYEFQARSQAVQANSTFGPGNNFALSAAGVQASVMTPVWLADQLLLARQVSLGDQTLVQGCWLDWPALREQLLANVRDLLADAQLEPADRNNEAERAHMMAALPVKLLFGDLPVPAVEGWSPVRLSLLVTWASLGLAALAVALLLHGVLALSERRAAFVSAVTHELRTPLTTFRMYAEMLVEGMVPDEENRRRYLQTLRTEADRLFHLVENVLAYARLERGGPAARIGPVNVGSLLERATERLAQRAAQADLEIRVDAPPAVLELEAVADPAAVEQILFNLVDNACKYAGHPDHPPLELTVGRAPGHVELRLRDHGPGVARRECKRLFQPFRKSARDAAHSAPGVGLGLALSRRLARDMGGDLALQSQTAGGACFVLTLKAVER